MRERFLKIKETFARRVDDFLRSTLDTPPSYEEVLESFQHSEGCSQDFPLKRVEEEHYPTFGDGGVWGTSVGNIPIAVKYLECPECHASVRYSG